MYRRMGKIMGIALRCKLVLSFSLPTLFWKKMVNLIPQRRDLSRIDAAALRYVAKLQKLMHLPPSGSDKVSSAATTPATATSSAADKTTSASTTSVANVDSELLRQLLTEHAMETFTCRLSDGRVRELVPHGKQVPVTRDSYKYWIQLFVEARLNESNAQIRAVLSGLSQIVPLAWFNLFTHHELDWLICGKPDYSVDELRSRVEYKEGVLATDPTTRFFWEVLYDFTPKEKSQFLFFVRGARRLPKDSKLAISRLPQGRWRDITRAYPVAHTCFFELSLPPYPSKEILEHRLKDAIFGCLSMDRE